jgi:hypothetical protein
MHNRGRIPEEVIEEYKQSNIKPLYKWVSPTPSKEKTPEGEPIYDEILFTDIKHSLWKTIRNRVRQAEESGVTPDVEEINELVFLKCVLWPEFTPEDLRTMPVGFMPSVTKLIQEKSQFWNVDVLGRVLGPDLTTVTLKEGDYWDDISDKELAAIKKEHKEELKKIRIGRWIFIARPVTRADITVAAQADDSEIALLERVVVWPKDAKWEDLPEGILISLGNAVNRISGWGIEGEVEEL